MVAIPEPEPEGWGGHWINKMQTGALHCFNRAGALGREQKVKCFILIILRKTANQVRHTQGE